MTVSWRYLSLLYFITISLASISACSGIKVDVGENTVRSLELAMLCPGKM